MLNVSQNQEWVKAIFRLLMTRQELQSQFNFYPEYLSENELGKSLATIYFPLRKLVYDSNMGWTYKAFEIAYFTEVKKELYPAYSGQNVDQVVIQTLNDTKAYLQSLFDSIEFAYQSLSEEFILDKLNDLCRAGCIQTKIMKYFSVVQTYAADDRDNDEVLDLIEKAFEDIDTKYLSPGSTQHRFFSPFDPMLRIKIDDTVYPTRIGELNYMLKGGFKTQTLSGFLTKTGGGKSTILLTLAADAIKQGQNVYFLNMEMKPYDVNNIVLSALTDRSVDEIERNLTNDKYMDAIQSWYEQNYKARFCQTTVTGLNGGFTMKDLAHDVRNAELKIQNETGTDFRFDLIIIDYLYLMQPVVKMMKNARSDEKYKTLVREAHDFALNEKYAVISVFQTNRGAEQKLRSNFQINADDIADSYSGLSDIDNMFMLASRYTDAETGEDGCLVTDIKIRKMYDGQKRFFFMKYDSEHCVYDSANSRAVEIADDEDEEEPVGKDIGKGRRKKYQITAEDVLKYNKELCNIPIGVIKKTMQSSGVSCVYKADEIVMKYAGRTKTIDKDYDWLNTEKGLRDDQIARWKKQVLEAIDKTKNIIASGVATNPDEIKITANDIFE